MSETLRFSESGIAPDIVDQIAKIFHVSAKEITDICES